MALKLNINEPVELSLDRTDPKPYNTNGRPSLMYSVTLADGTKEKAFLTQKCADTIQQLQIQANERFTICRRKTPQGVEFFDLHTPANRARNANATPANPTPERKPPVSASHSRTQASSIMGAALIAAIDAVKIAEKHAKENGIPVEFGPADVRAIANTLFIAATRDPTIAERMGAERAA